jgi:hypothetical protein
MPLKKGNRVRLLAESDAREGVREIFQQIKETLGLPHVGALYRAFAVYPAFLELHWKAFRPALNANQFFELADRLRADAYTRAFNYFDVPDLSVLGDEQARRSLIEVTDLLQYENPILLLITAAQLQAFDGVVGRTASPPLSVTHPVYSRSPACLQEQQAPAPMRRIYEELRHMLGTSFVSYEYRALAHYPEFFMQYWTALKKWAASPIYKGIQHGFRESAWAMAREVPHPLELTVNQLSEAGLADEEIAAVMRITELFVDQLSSLLLNITLARIGIEGGTRPRIPARQEKAA